jgi:hypothetical protein
MLPHTLDRRSVEIAQLDRELYAAGYYVWRTRLCLHVAYGTYLAARFLAHDVANSQ